MTQARKIKHHATADRSDASQLLGDLAAALADGTLSLATADERVELNPSGIVDVELKVRSDGGRESIRIELSWERARPALQIVTDEGAFVLGEEPADHDASDTADDDEEDRPSLAQMLDDLSRDRLYELAQSHDIAGRSSMDKAELVVALDEVMEVDDLNKEDLAVVAAARTDQPSASETRDELLEQL